MKHGLLLGSILGCWTALASTDAGDAPDRASQPSGRGQFDGSRLRRGHFTYRTVLGGKEVGGSTISVIRLEDGNYRFRNEVTGQFRQTWEAVATRLFEPRTVTLGLGQGDDRSRSMSLVYEGRRVSGTTTRFDPVTGTRTSSVSASVPDDVVDQRIDWAAVMATSMNPGQSITFSVYDPWTGVSRVTSHVGEPASVTVPAGTFETRRLVYLIEKSSGSERYEVWASKTTPRFIVQEEFPNGAAIQLVRVVE